MTLCLLFIICCCMINCECKEKTLLAVWNAAAVLSSQRDVCGF